MEFIRRNTDYGIRALVYMSKRPKDHIFLVKHLAQEAEVSDEFLRKILQKLANVGIVKSHRGPQGGFSLAKDPEKITVLEVMEVLQGPVAINRCFLGKSACPNYSTCEIKDNLTGAQREMLEILDRITIADLAGESIKTHKPISSSA